jgi:YbbR domain-containing protein
MSKRHLHILLVTFAVGCLLWLSVNLRETYQITVAVPLTIDDIPAGMAIRTPVPSTLQVRYRGDGWRLAAILMGPDPHLVIPLSSLPPGRRAITINEVLDRLPVNAGVQILDMIPDTITVALDRYAERRVAVEPDCVFSFRDGYGQVGEVTIVPESVTIGGAETLLAEISSWKTEPTTFRDLKSPVDAEVNLAQGGTSLIACMPPVVRIRMNVQPFAEKVFSGLPVEVLNLPANRDLICIPPKLEIVARGGIRQLANLMSSDFQVVVDFDETLTDSTQTLAPKVTGPAGITIVTRKPERVQYIVRRRL